MIPVSLGILSLRVEITDGRKQKEGKGAPEHIKLIVFVIESKKQISGLITGNVWKESEHVGLVGGMECCVEA